MTEQWPQETSAIPYSEMKSVPFSTRIRSSSRMRSLVFISFSLCLIYLLILLLLPRSSKIVHDSVSNPTSLDHIVFGIASNQESLLRRKEYIRLWWKPWQMRGCLFLDSLPNDTRPYKDPSLPAICISEGTSRFRYTNKWGSRSAIRLARVVLETVRLKYSNVRWFVFGDDDTVFFPENLVKTLSKYDHQLWYYVGTNSEIYEQNMKNSFNMAFAGAGFAISYPLAKVLAKVLDSCIQRYPHLYGSDSRVYACLTELGVELTREPGFHQFDVRGNLFGLLAAHPMRPLVSFHHLDHAEPIFPNMTTIKALEYLYKAADIDPQRILQQTVCYDRWFSWTISVSWGYAVQVFDQHNFFPDVLSVQLTFRQWQQGDELARTYNFNTREVHADPCERPTVFFLHSISSYRDGIKSIYKKVPDNCRYDVGSPKRLEEIRVFSHKLDLDIKQLQAPRRDCCNVLKSSAGKLMEIAIRECKEDDLIYIHP